MRIIVTTRAIGVAAILGAAPAAAQADDCATIMSAMFAAAKVAYASSITTTIPGQPAKQSTVVVTGGTMYVQVNGAWHSMPYSAQEIIDRATEKAKTSKQICQKVGAEDLNGEAATIYSHHVENNRTVADGRVWISDASGLPLKIDEHFDGGMAFVQTTRYDNIQPPAGAK